MPGTNKRHVTTTVKPHNNGEPGRKAFISAPGGGDTKALRKGLGRRGVDSFFEDEMDLPGRSLPEVLVEGMAEADLIIAILDTERNNSNVRVHGSRVTAVQVQQPLKAVCRPDAHWGIRLARVGQEDRRELCESRRVLFSLGTVWGKTLRGRGQP